MDERTQQMLAFMRENPGWRDELKILVDEHVRSVARTRERLERELGIAKEERGGSVSLAQKEVQELIKEIRSRTQYKVVSSGKHHRVLKPNGAVLVDENGPVIISKTPSESRWREMTVHRLIKNGVFKEDPRKEGQKAKAKEGARGRNDVLTRDETRRLQREAVQRLQNRRMERTKRVRERIEPLVAKVGGWAKGHNPDRTTGVVPAELGIAAFHWGTQRGRVDRPKTLNSLQVSIYSKLIKGGTFSDQNADFWEAFVNEWEAAPNASRWYFDLLREARGLPPTKVVEGPDTGPTVPEAPVPERVSSVAEQVAEKARKRERVAASHAGHLALKAVYLMTSGREDPDMHEILSTGEKILELELGENGA